MGLTDDDIAWRSSSRMSWAMRIMFSSFLTGMFFGVLMHWVRGAQLFTSDPNFPLIPAFISGGSVFLLSWATRRMNGGFVHWTQVFSIYIVNFLLAQIGVGKTSANKEGLLATADSFVRRLHVISLLWYLFLGIGQFAGGILAWGILDAFSPAGTIMGYTQYTPGPFPGFSAGFTGQAFAVEIISTVIISAVVTYFYLINRADYVPAALGLSVFVTTALSFNISGGAFDVVWWVASSLAACVPPGVSPCFIGASQWWWAYTFGPLLGSILGVIIAVLVHRFSPVVREYMPVKASASATAQQALHAAQQQYSRPSAGSAGTNAVASVGASLFEDS